MRRIRSLGDGTFIASNRTACFRARTMRCAAK